MAGVTTEVRDGRPVAVKRARAADDIAHLEHEARMLSAAGHPGVVALVGLDRTGGEAVLVTALAGSRTLGEEADPAMLATLAALTATVADLHALGVVHGRIEPSHVVIAADGHPVLCGFGDAALTDEGADPITDVRAIGTLLLELADRTDDAGLARRLRPVAERAAAAESGSGPSARSVASSLQPLVPAPGDVEERGDAGDPIAALRRGVRAAAERPRRWSLPTARVLAGGLAAIAAIAAAVALALASDTDATPAPEAVATTTSSSTSTTVAGPELVWPPDAEPVILESGGARYQLGEPGDRVAVGDWDCDGTATPALLRPSTGDVFVFTTWAQAGRDLTIEASARVTGGRAITAGDPDGDGCDDVVVATPAGSEVVQ